MKVAIPAHSGKVDEHFGHSEFFAVYTVNESKEIIHEELMASPQGCGCRSNIIEQLSAMGVKTMLAGNIGGGAVNKLNNNGINVIRGCSGDIKKVLKDWLDGNIQDNGELCREHEHHHGNNHEHHHGENN